MKKSIKCPPALLGLLIAIIVFLPCNLAWGQTDILDLADLPLDEIEPNDPNQPQALPFDPANNILAVGVAGALSDSNDEDGYSFTLDSAELVDLKFEITAGSDTDIIALDIGPDNQAYFITGGGLWRQPTDINDPNNPEQLVTADQLAQPLGLTAETLNVSDMAILADPNQTLILITMTNRGDILSVDLDGNVAIALSESKITDITGQLTADLASIAVGQDIFFPTPPDSNENPIILMQTNMGDIEFELFPNSAPITVQNFLDYIESGYYEDVIFHRVVDNFVIQGGGFDSDLVQKNPNPPIISEAALNRRRNLRGTIAMALTGQDANSGTSQFFVNLVDNNFLDFDVSNPPFTVFAEVLPDSMTVVDAIAQLPTENIGGAFTDIPIDRVIIESVTVTNDEVLPDPPQTIFPVYVTDQTSGHVLELSLDSSDVTIFAHTDDLTDTLQRELSTGDLLSGTTKMPQTIVAEKEGRFSTTALVRMPNGQLYPEGFFVSQLGEATLGDGSVTHILPNADNPTEAIFTTLFDPEDFPNDDLFGLNPSALAWDSDGAFGGKLFLGTFGASPDDEFDAEVFIVEPNGLLQPFVTGLFDLQGDPIPIGFNQTDGFFDITDMAFSFGGAFGQFLYVLSENIDNPLIEGGSQSDIWRIDPNGRAELFAADIADGAITLAFGSISYGGDLFVGTLSTDGQTSGQILRVNSNGSVEMFLSFTPFSQNGGGFSVSDIVFTPFDSLFQGNLLLTLHAGQRTFLVEVPPNQNSSLLPPFWASELQTGAVFSGDMAFDDQGNLYILEQATKRLTQLDYQNLLDYSFTDLQIRLDGNPINDPNYIPYVSLTVVNQPRILGLGDGQAGNIATEVSPQFLDIDSIDEDDQGNSIAFTFDNQGDIFLFVQNSGDVQTSVRDDDLGDFTQFTTAVTRSALETESGLSDIEVTHLGWVENGTLVAKANHGPDADLDPEEDNGLFDDTLLSLGNTFFDSFFSQTLLASNELTSMKLNLTGPVTNETFDIFAGNPFERTFDLLETGDFTLAITPQAQTFGDYDLLVALATQTSATLIAAEATGPQVVTTRDGERLELTLTGTGLASLAFDQRPGSGVVITLRTLTLQGTDSKTVVQLRNLDNPGNIILEEIILDGPLAQLEMLGQLDVITAIEASKGTIKQLDMGDLLAINAPNYRIKVLAAENLGDPNEAQGEFDLQRVDQLLVGSDINNIRFLNNSRRNVYKEIIVGGVIIDSSFFGTSIKSLSVDNQDDQTNALDNATFTFSEKNSRLKRAWIARGNVANSNFFFSKRIDHLELVDGNLESTTIQATGRKGMIRTILIRRLGNQPNENAGNMIDSSISATKRIHWVHADGQISGTTRFATSTSLPGATVNRISSGGDLTANINSVIINKIHAGVDQNDQRLSEDEDFTGANITGTIFGILRLREVSATGSISDATLQCNFGSIINIFAEDGFTNTTVQVAKNISRIMIGYINGKRNQVINTQADVSGTISARKLGRIYSTGSQVDINLDNVRRIGPLIENDTGF